MSTPETPEPHGPADGERPDGQAPTAPTEPTAPVAPTAPTASLPPTAPTTPLPPTAPTTPLPPTGGQPLSEPVSEPRAPQAPPAPSGPVAPPAPGAPPASVDSPSAQSPHADRASESPREPRRTSVGPRTSPIVWGALILALCGYATQRVFGGGALDTAWWITATVIGLGVLLLGVGAAVIARGRRARR